MIGSVEASWDRVSTFDPGREWLKHGLLLNTCQLKFELVHLNSLPCGAARIRVSTSDLNYSSPTRAALGICGLALSS